MHDTHFLIELGIVLAAALAGGLVARLMRLPVLVGYLAAGIVVGPYTPGLVADTETVPAIANIGVVLLMFAVGVQFSLKELNAVKLTAVGGGMIQILGTVALGVGVATIAGWGWIAGLFLGCAIALSSTAVSMRLLEERGELGSTHGAIVLGICIVQDLALVVMVSLLPALAAISSPGTAAASTVIYALVRAFLFIAATLLLATRLIPRLFHGVTRTGSSELFLLTTVCLAFVAAVIAESAGMGIAIGAFLAGVVISESPYAHEVFSQVRPLRDVFSSIFFVSIGMLLDPSFVFENWRLIGSIILTVLIGKGLLTVFAVRATGWHSRTALFAGAGLANIGEFSFVLAGEGQTRGLIGPEVGRIVVATALVTILAAPFLYAHVGRIYVLLARTRTLRRWMLASKMEHLPGTQKTFRPRALVLGGGRVGRYTSEALERQGVEHVIVDFDSAAIDRARKRGVPVLYGDATSRIVLERVHPEKADLAIVALPEAVVTEMAVKVLRELAPDLTIIARVRRGADMQRMRDAGATALVHGEFESGVEMIRQSLWTLGFSPVAVEEYISDVRANRYGLD